MNENRRSPWLGVILGLGCLCLGCGCLLVFGGGAAFFLSDESKSSLIPKEFFTVTIEGLEPEIKPTRVEETQEKPLNQEPASETPVVEEPSDDSNVEESTDDKANLSEPIVEETVMSETEIPGPALTGKQQLDSHRLFDDFSSDALDWPLFDDGKTILKYENQAYSFQITEPDYLDWAYFPVDFLPYEISFDVKGTADQLNGTFGVYCQYLDEENFYYVEFDLRDNSYVITEKLDGELIPLTKQNSVGQYWQKASALKSPSTSTNHIAISCYPDNITLIVNDKFTDQVDVTQPFDQPGEAAFFVYASNFEGDKGYKVYFDNVEIFQPVQ